MTPLQPRRLAAAAAAGLLAAGIAALPASAQDLAEPEIIPELESLVMPTEDLYWGQITVDIAQIYENDPNVTIDMAIDAPAGTFEFDLEVGDNECEVYSEGTGFHCEQVSHNGYSAYFNNIGYGPTEQAELGVYEYTLTATIEGVPIEPYYGTIEVTDFAGMNPHKPFTHGNVQVTGVSPGSTVDVSPVFLQERPLADTAAAVVVAFGDPFSRVGMDLEGAEAIADYDNCMEGRWGSDRGVTCVITHFQDLQGSLFTLSDDSPVTYAISEDAPGPIDLCACYYNVYTVDAQTLEDDFGGVFWDEASDDLFSLKTTDTWDGPTDEGDAPYMGTINIVTAENPYDLAVTSANIEGSEGDEVTVTVPVTNNGPAAAYHYVDSFGSYNLRAQLPAGTELVRIDSDGGAWSCIDEDSLDGAYEYIGSDSELDHFDLSCYFKRLAPGETLDFTFTVKVNNAATATDGLIEVGAIYGGEDGESLDGDLESNLAVIGVNAADMIGGGDDADASGKLPVTGGSMTIIIAAAAAALAAGAVMFVVVRRRKAAADW